jgi:hypothetical protein
MKILKGKNQKEEEVDLRSQFQKKFKICQKEEEVDQEKKAKRM